MTAKKKSPTKKSTAAPNGGLIIPEKIAPLVHVLRHEKIILDTDLAELYGVTTSALNQAVQRNINRFPPDFMFQITQEEMDLLQSQIAMAKNEQPSLRSQSVILKPGRGQPVNTSPTSSPNKASPCSPAYCTPPAPWK